MLPLKRWGSEIDIELVRITGMEPKPEFVMRQAYAELLRSLVVKITMKNDQNEYLYAMPSVIIASTITDNLNVKLVLTCVRED